MTFYSTLPILRGCIVKKTFDSQTVQNSVEMSVHCSSSYMYLCTVIFNDACFNTVAKPLVMIMGFEVSCSSAYSTDASGTGFEKTRRP